jgi:methoxymalonate biosynthesis acyl carrier protein
VAEYSIDKKCVQGLYGYQVNNENQSGTQTYVTILNNKAKIKEYLSSFLRNHDLQDDEDIFALGFVNSLFAMQLVLFVESVFEITIKNEEIDLDNFRTINAIADLIERNALHVPDQSRPEPGGDYVAHRTSTEKTLAEIWAKFLDIEKAGVFDNFFDLGGHSLLSIQVIARIEEKLGVHLNPRDLMFQTLGQIASLCDERMQNIERYDNES